MNTYIVFFEFYIKAEDIFEAEKEAAKICETALQPVLVDKVIVTVRGS